MTEPGILPRIIELTKQIVSPGRTGSARERYQLEHLWELGDALAASNLDEAAAWYSVEAALHGTGLSSQPTLLRNAVRVRRYWPDRASFAKVAASLGSYGKLKDTIQLFDPAYAVPSVVLEGFLKAAHDATYTETLDLASRLKSKYILGDSRIDADELLDVVAEATAGLRGSVESNEPSQLSALRRSLDPAQSRGLRLLLSTLQKPSVRERYRSELAKVELPSPETLESAGFGGLGAAVRLLTPLRDADPKAVEKAARGIGLSFLGDLATILKATESDEERRRYLANQKVLQRFVSQQAGGI